MMLFQSRPFWMEMGIPYRILKSRSEYFFGKERRTIEDRQEALKILLNVTETIQKEMVQRFKTESTYGLLLKLYFIYDEVHSLYLKEKEARLKLVDMNIDETELNELFIKNRNIQRNIIDASNIWIENCVLFQHDLNIKELEVEKEFVMDYGLIVDLYLYGFASQGVSLLMLSKSIGEQNTYYGLEITQDDDIPAEILKYHPYIYFNTAIVGNQNALIDNPLTTESNDTDFGVGFFEENKVHFLHFLAAIKCFHEDQLRGDIKSLTIITKERFIQLAEQYTKPKIDGDAFYSSFVLTGDKMRQQLRENEEIIWIVGTNKYRHELRPFIGLDDGNVIIAYGALEQAKQIWVSYYSNGGMCYTNPRIMDRLQKSMEKRNNELSNILVEKIRDILNKHYEPKINYKDVKYQRIFGEREIDYGDFDIVYYCENTKELFLIESKYFSDSLNSSSMVTDYKKLFEKGGYYTHCRSRYDLVLENPEKIKAFVDVTDKIKIHMLFISSKPIEIELQDKDEVVTFLSLNIFEKYITGNLISGEDDSIVRPAKVL